MLLLFTSMSCGCTKQTILLYFGLVANFLNTSRQLECSQFGAQSNSFLGPNNRTGIKALDSITAIILCVGEFALASDIFRAEESLFL